MSYNGRHRTAAPISRTRRHVVTGVLLAATVAGGLVIRDAGAAPLSADAAATKSRSNPSAQLGLTIDSGAVDAATSARDRAGTSRDNTRRALTGSAPTSAADPPTAQVAAAEQAQAQAMAARLAAAEKTRAVNAAKAAADARAKTAADAKAKAAQLAAAEKAKAVEVARAAAAAHRWVTPLSAGYTLTSGFGYRWGKLHPAQDLATPVGSPVSSLSSGTVIFAGWDDTGYGNLVRIQYWDGTVSYMAHNSTLVVSVGETVAPGQLVAYSGSTGHSTGPHVHLEIRPDGGAPVPPLPWLARHGVTI